MVRSRIPLSPRFVAAIPVEVSPVISEAVLELAQIFAGEEAKLDLDLTLGNQLLHTVVSRLTKLFALILGK